MEPENNSLSSEALSLTALSLEFCNVVASASVSEPQDFLRDVLRYLPRLYIMLADLKPYGEETDDFESLDTQIIGGVLTEEDYDVARQAMAATLGEYDSYLDAQVEDMQFSDTPVAVDLSTQIADIFQCTVDFVAAMKMADPTDTADVLADMKYRFHTYLSDLLCSALRAANRIYQSQVLLHQE